MKRTPLKQCSLQHTGLASEKPRSSAAHSQLSSPRHLVLTILAWGISTLVMVVPNYARAEHIFHPEEVHGHKNERIQREKICTYEKMTEERIDQLLSKEYFSYQELGKKVLGAIMIVPEECKELNFYDYAY